MATFDPSKYEQQRRNLFANYAQNLATNAYRRYLAETRGQRPILELEEAAFGEKKEVPRLTASYGRRGLVGKGVQSGVYNKALSDYAMRRARQLGYARQDLADVLRGYDLGTAGFQSAYEQGLADLEAQKARDIAADAAAISSLS